MKMMTCGVTKINERSVARAVIAFLVVVLTCMATNVYALPLATIDQQNGGSDLGVTLGTVGQSFTPTFNRIDGAEFVLRNFGTTATVQLDLFAGVGYGGALLGSSLPMSVTSSTPTAYHFDFVSPINLTPGNQYSLRLNSLAFVFFAMSSNTNTYAGGTKLDNLGNPLTIDLNFIEGLHASNAAPEPRTLVSALLGLLSLGMVRGRRRL